MAKATKKKVDKKKEEQLKEALDTTISGTKTFEVDGFGTVTVRFPSIEESRIADYKYTQALNKAMMRDGLPTTEEMEKFLRDRGIWTEEDDKKLEELQKEMDDQLIAISKVKSDKAAEPFRKRMAELREEINQLRSKRNFYMNQTAENKADEERIGYLTWACSINAETGERLWDTFEDFKNERNQRAVGQIAYQLLSLMAGIDDELLADLPQEEVAEATLGEGEGEKKTERDSEGDGPSGN